MRTPSRAHFLLLAAVVLVPAPATSDPRCGDGIPYALTEESAWLEGCIVGPCLCPILLLDDLSGSFALVEIPTMQPGPWRFFEVCDVRWTLGRGEVQVEIRGSGFYQTAAPVLDEHRLFLELERDGDPLEPLDSGVVAGAMSFPAIGIQALTSGYCYQEGIQLAAVPVPEPTRGLQQLAGLVTLWMLSRLRAKRRALITP
jgi:hypothetical protein